MKKMMEKERRTEPYGAFPGSVPPHSITVTIQHIVISSFIPMRLTTRTVTPRMSSATRRNYFKPVVMISYHQDVCLTQRQYFSE